MRRCISLEEGRGEGKRGKVVGGAERNCGESGREGDRRSF